jgi:hypothetical protein
MFILLNKIRVNEKKENFKKKKNLKQIGKLFLALYKYINK